MTRTSEAEVVRTLRWGTLAIVLFWSAIMGLVYMAMAYYLKPAAMTVSADGDLVIARARDGHFYAQGSVAGHPVQFLVDTGASLVTVSADFAAQAGLSGGVATVFRTANGDLPGRIVSGVPVVVGPLRVSTVRVGVGLVGLSSNQALLGQSFLSRFEMTLTGSQMVLRQKAPG